MFSYLSMVAIWKLLVGHTMNYVEIRSYECLVARIFQG